MDDDATLLPVEDLSLSDRLTQAPEVRLIGRVIQLRHEGRTFEGVATYVTKQTVVLANCDMFTDDQLEQRDAAKRINFRDSHDRKARRARTLRERQRHDPGPPAANAPAPSDDEAADEPPQPIAPTRRMRREPEQRGDPAAAPSEREPFGDSDTASPSDAAASPTTPSATVVPDPPTRIPFVTFGRRRIHNVRLMDNRPVRRVKEKPPDQLLRAFVRRYVIHSELGNIPVMLTVRQFVKNRTGWANPPEAYIDQLFVEEREAVKEAATEIAKDRVARRQMLERAPEPVPHGIRPPRVEEDEDGRAAFHLSGVTSKTTYVAVLHLILGIVVLLYTASVFSTASEAVVADYVETVTAWVAVSATGQLLAAAGAGVHALRMKVPVNVPIAVARLVVTLAAMGMLITASYVTSTAAYDMEQPFTGETHEAIYRQQVREKPQALCTYAARQSCGGWNARCVYAAWDSTYCPSICATTVAQHARHCKGVFEKDIITVLVPVCAMQYVGLIVFLIDLLQYHSFVQVAWTATEERDARAARR